MNKFIKVSSIELTLQISTCSFALAVEYTFVNVCKRLYTLRRVGEGAGIPCGKGLWE